MESAEKHDEFNSVPAKIHNVTKIFGSLLGPESQWDESLPQMVSLTPSEYMNQLLMTTEERMELLTRDSSVRTHNFLSDTHDFCGFQAVPNIVVFQQYTSGNIYNVTLTVQNTTKASHYLKLDCESEPAFKVEYIGSPSLNIRLAAGMHSTYNVYFSPEENRDYEYEIKFVSDHGNFVVPVIAIGPRPILDFPDLIAMPETAVKISSIKSLLVRNLGDIDAAFNVHTTSPYFSLEPSKGVIEEEETVQFVVNFLSTKTGFFEGYFFLTYDTGEVVRIQLQGSSVNCNVRLERGCVRMQDETYLGLSTSKTLKIFNRSDYIVKYQWMRYKDDDTDRAKKEEYANIFGLINKAEMTRCMDLVHYNISTPQVHELVCQRIYADEVASLMNESFPYNNSHFSLVPMEGEIWPENSVEITVYFEPDEIGELSSTAYLEVTGHQDRIPLSLNGLSIGPLLKLNVATINVENIFLCSVHTYQIVCANKGLIPGSLVYKPKSSDFGGSISVTPKQMKLQPGQYKALNVSFSSNRNGDFIERIEFVVKESLEIVALYIQGCVICPTLHFDKSRLDFGTTALGFTSKQQVILYNDSLVAVTFSICVPDDGLQAAITHQDFVKAARKPSFPSSPREFQIIPHEGVVDAQSSLKISFTANTARMGNTNLRVDMWDTDSVYVSLPISFRSKVASLVVKPKEIAIRFCFLNLPYTRTFTVENNSEVAGYFYIVQQPSTDCASIQYSMSMHQGYLEPGDSKTVSLTIITRAMGIQKSVMSMLTFGEKGPSPCCLLTCNGQGPVVTVCPTTLECGEVELLKEKTFLLTLISDSPVPTEFTAALCNENSSWEIMPRSGDLSPFQSLDLKVTILLRDVGKHVDKIIVTIPNARDISVSLNAIGIGSCIVCDPDIFPTFDMGLLFSNQSISLPIDVTNQGSRNLKLIFSNSMEMRLMHGGQIQTPAYNRFSIEPLVVEIPAQSTRKVSCNVRSDVCDTVSEQWWLCCLFEGQRKREIIGNSTFIAKFIEPSMSFDKRELIFRIDMGRDVEKSQKIEQLIVTNESGLNLHCILTIDEPFRFINGDGDHQETILKIIIKKHGKLGIRVIFSPKEEMTNRRSKIYNGILKLEYQDHPNVETIKCLASVNFPNIAPLPEEIRFDCPLGCSVVKNILIKNNNPLEVSYKFVWIEESISIKHGSSSLITEENNTAKYFKEKIQSDNPELLSETRKLLLGILMNSLSKEVVELSEMENIGNPSQVTEDINRICSILPCEGIIPGHSSQCIYLGFHGVETLTLEAKLLCKIDGGPSELIKVFAAADNVQFILEKERLDFGTQVIWESRRETIKLENHSRIQLIYHIELGEKLDESFEIQPISATIPAQSTAELEITFRPMIPSSYNNCFKLCIEHHIPISILVEGVAIIPQVYISLPRNDVLKNYSAEFGYRALQFEPQSFYQNHTLEEDEKGWQVVIQDESLPSAIDIDMAIERLIAKEFIEETYSSMLMRNTISKDAGPIPYLFAPEYILDMGYVIVGQSAQASIRVYNYSTRSVRIRLNKSKMEKFAKQGICIHLRDENCLMPGEYTSLEVSFRPVRLKSSEKRSVIGTTFYLEVANGFTLPITILASVTYPSVTLNMKIVDFNDVLVSECMLIYLLIKNEGPIDCQWEAKLPHARRNKTDGPFCLGDTSAVFSPGQSGNIKIYFKPQQSGYVVSSLTVEVNHGIKPMMVELRGRGIQHKLRIVQPWIHFPAVLPYGISVGKDFIIENVGQRAVEVYWQHLDQNYLQEARLIRVLMHYYQVEEILLPPRRPPDITTLPAQLVDFYNNLVDEMILSMRTQHKIDSNPVDISDTATVVNYSEEAPRRKRRGSSTRKISTRLTTTESTATAISEANLSALSETDVYGVKRSNLPYDEPDEIEKLLHCFIDDLQKQPDFYEKMKDPVKDVFDLLENKAPHLDISSLPKNRKMCIIFHGVPSTEYEQAACKTARVLEVPLLSLNNAITEMIALGNTACSAKIREIIDAKYRELLTDNEKSQFEETRKILSIDELSSLDCLTRYEYKIEEIQKNGNRKSTSVPGNTPRGGKRSAKRGDKSPQTPRVTIEETFLDIDVRLLVEILKQRLSMKDLSESFVLLSLNNNFIKNEEKTLALLLEILGDVEYPIFVTLHESVESRESKRSHCHDNTQAGSMDETMQKLMQIDEMSASEFDILSITNRELYRDKIILVRSQEALQRRTEFQRRIAELRKQREQRQKNASKDGKGKNEKKRKSKTLEQSSRASDRLTTLDFPNKKKNRKIESTSIPGEVQTVNVDETGAHNSNLEAILSILQTWDNTRKSNAPSQKVQANGRFSIWHVKATPIPSEKMIVNEIKRNKPLLNPKAEVSLLDVDGELRPQMYSVIRPKKLTPAEPVTPRNGVKETDVFDLVALKYDANLSSEIPSKDETIATEATEETLKSRLILQPHESRIFRAYFRPKRVGFFQEIFPLIIQNSDELSYSIKVNGSADVPRLDMEPSHIFTKIKRVKKDEMNDPTFFTDRRIFDFGSLLLTGKDNKIHRRKASLKFSNPSKMDLELETSLFDENSKNYSIEPRELSIKPNEHGVVIVTAAVSKLGPNEDQLVLLIKNNPHVQLIEMRSNGVKLDVELEGKQISFGTILMYREVTKTLRVLNNSLVPIYWRITPVDTVEAQIKFSPTKGWTKAQTKSNIIFTYLASRIGILEKKSMAFKVFLNEEDDYEDPLFQDTITTTGETYDVSVDITFANPIALGTLMVGSVARATFDIKNRGFHKVNFMVELQKVEKWPIEIDGDLRGNFREDLHISPSVGTVEPDKIATINVSFQPKFEMRLKEAPLLRCNLFDPNNSTTSVAEFTLTVSIASHYVRFRLVPDSEISFGPIGICTNKALHLSIENIGIIPLKYQLRNAIDPITNEEGSKKQKKNKSAPPDTTKHDTAKSGDLIENLRVGPFTFSKSGGSIAPGDIETLRIDCYPETEGHIQERILVSVEDSAPEYMPHRSINLNVDSCLPSVDLSDLDAMFPESYIVDEIRDFVCPKGIDAHTVFARDERHLYFKRIIIQKTHTATIKLYNRGKVAARVTVSLRPDVLTVKNAKPEAFVLDTVQETVLPMSSQVFTISFTPILIETYTGMLETTVELPVNRRNDSTNKFSIKLSGEGCVPEVILVEPSISSVMHGPNSRIAFGRCLVHETSSRNLAFKNIGNVTAKVIVDINHDDNMLYIIRTLENLPSLTGNWIHENDVLYVHEKRSIVCSVQPGDVARFLVEFQPREVERKQAEIRLHVLDNPYENITIELDGEGFIENVVLVGLPLVETPGSRTSDGRSRKPTKYRDGTPRSIKGSGTSIALQHAASAPELVYNLDYGTCFINKMHKINFKIVNKSAELYFRFELDAHPNVVFVPSVGHLQPSGSKDIAATFLATEPITLKQFYLQCDIYEILFPGERHEVNLWDDRQTNVEWIPVDSEASNITTFQEGVRKKAIVPSTEPVYEIVAGTGRSIRLMFSAVAAFTEYSCSVKEINFNDTLMFQNREYLFTVENPGNVDVSFDWKIDMDVEYPKRLSSRAAAFRAQTFRSNVARPSSRSSGGVLYAEAQKRTFPYVYSRNQGDNKIELESSSRFNNCRALSSRDNFSAIAVEPCVGLCAPVSDLFGNSSAGTHSSTESSINDGDDEPFTIKPSRGEIPAGQSLQFTLRFSPLDVFHYKAYLVCQIENLSPNLEPLTIPVLARSLLPYCHFEIEESDYLTRRQNSQEKFAPAAGGDTNDSTHLRVVECRVIGTGEWHKKEFYLINPTTENYRFTWKDITSRRAEEMPYFHCIHEEGLAESGKRFNIIFKFFAEEIGTFESLWRFSIDNYGLETIFLLVAIVTEPAVYSLYSRLRMKPSVLGSIVEETVIIVNDENFELPFKILPDSLHSEEQSLQVLRVSPMTGIFEPKSQQIFQISYVPRSVGDFTFLLQCQVKRMKSPLIVVVTANTRKIMPKVVYITDIKGQDQAHEAHNDRETILDFGMLTLNKAAVIKFVIENIGDVAFNYNWELGVEDPGGSYYLALSKQSDLVLSDTVSTCYLELTAVHNTMIRHHPVTLNISKGPAYRMFVKASAKRPSVEFSFIKYDFGPCYIRDKNSPAYVAQLLVTNNNKTPAIIECNFPDNLPHMSVNVDEAPPQAIPGNSSVTLPISFRPLEELRYNETLNFLINNSAIEQTISIKGEGIPYKICLENLRDKFVELGNVTVGKIVTRKIRVLNAGRAPVKISFDLIKRFACHDEFGVLESRKKSRSSEHFYNAVGDKEEILLTLKEILSIQPREIIVLPSNKSVQVVVKFKPTKRINSFVEKIGARVDSTILPLFFLRGSCVARQFRLNRTHLYFGIVVEGCSTETKLVLENTGDFGARFKWNVAKLQPHFDLKPITGYSSPGMDVTFTVNFHPIELASLLEAEAIIDVEKYASLRVSCSGACCRIPDPIESLNFSVPVRSAQSRDLTITNDTDDVWRVNTVVTGKFFSTEETFSISPKKSYSCSLTYTPLVMNNERNPHQGKVIVKLPDNKQPLVYTLVGLSLPPVVVAKIVRQLPAKVRYTELLPVYNWLNKLQSFSCSINLVNDTKVQTNPVLFSFTGNGNLDVPANGTRDYRALFYCFKEANLNFQIKFTNNEGEYEFYEVQYKVTKPDVLSTIKLTTSARSTICYLLEIDNPLEDRSVSFTVNCQHRDITIQQLPKVVPAKTSDNIAIEYSPILPGEDTAKLDVICAELGNFPYELKLKATATPAEKITRVTAMLGSSTTFPIVIVNSSKRSAEFSIKVDDSSFTCDKSLLVYPQKENILEITYEPSEAKNVTATLYAVSEILGEYIFPLIGSYTLPKPQGPFTISPNSSLSLVFKNVFPATKSFAYVLDGPEDFSIITPSEVIESKKIATIVVKFHSSNDPMEQSLGEKYSVTGKLLVTCSDPALSHIAWIYYLRGSR